MLKNRIVEHVKVRAKDIVPHELNYRTHPKEQKEALKKLYEEIGFARSLLAYRLSDGRLKLIDGHLRQNVTPDEEVDVEVLDVNDEEAKKLLLAIDPLAQLAGTDQEVLAKLSESIEEESEAISLLWQALAKENPKANPRNSQSELAEKYAVVAYCKNEKEQTILWRELKKRGIQVEMKTI